MPGSQSAAAVEFENVDILFGRRGARLPDPAISKALELVAGGADRGRISAETGVVLGVTGANLSVRAGEISVLMGLSGSGKSTLLRAANGLNPVTRGQVRVRHAGGIVDVATCDASTLRDVRRKSIAMVFQQFALLPWGTVRENVGLGLEFQGVAPEQRRRIVDEKLALVGLSDWAERRTQELSGGMQQRVGLARAFATDADILLMDEPFSALDPLIRTRLQDELLSLQATVQKTILFVSHDLDEALKLGDQITILEGGRIIQTGTGEDIILRPATEYVAEFVRHMNPLSFLTGATAMRPVETLAREPGGVWLDSRKLWWLAMDSEGRATEARLDGAPLSLVRTIEASDASPAGLVVTDPSMPLGTLIRLCQASGHPVVLESEGRVRGVCGEAEIVKALSGVDRP